MTFCLRELVDYLPVNLGGRFSMKARVLSRKSSVRWQMGIAQVSREGIQLLGTFRVIVAIPSLFSSILSLMHL